MNCEMKPGVVHFLKRVYLQPEQSRALVQDTLYMNSIPSEDSPATFPADRIFSLHFCGDDAVSASGDWFSGNRLCLVHAPMYMHVLRTDFRGRTLTEDYTSPTEKSPELTERCVGHSTGQEERQCDYSCS